MAKQTIKWTALPNGQSGSTMRLSVFVTPTLSVAGDGALDQFPDFLDWPARIATAQFRVRFGGGPTVEAARLAPDPDPLDSALWSAIFTPKTLVKSSGPAIRLSDRIGSFSVRDVVGTIEDLVAGVALDSPTEPPLLQTDAPATGLSRSRLDAPVRRRVRRGAAETPAATDGASARLSGALRLREGLKRVTPSDAGPSVQSVAKLERRTDARVGPEARVDASRASTEFARANRFHTPVASAATLRVPAKELTLALKRIDFHEIVSSLGRYPRLLRRLGLVIDLEVPAAPGVPPSSVVAVEVEWTPASPTEQAYPWTRYHGAGSAAFAAAPRDPESSDLTGGMLKLGDPDRFDLVQIDVDSAAVQVMAQAGAGEEAPTPTLRSAGLAVAKVDRATYLALALNRQFALTDLVVVGAATGAGAAPQATAPEILHADDLVRGYRMDVRDETTGQWYSLCRRVGAYRFAGRTDPLMLEDEGWASSAVTKPGGPDSDEVLIHEVLFRWDGWSLVAPRPGKPIQAEGVPEGDARFGLDVSFAPPEGSLPRLRFGREYRVRARAVDLAGNGVPFASTDDTAASEVERYTRHEPVAAPVLTPRESLLPKFGESLERLVIRSYNDAPAKDSSVCQEAAERHVAPPRVSQQMAEQHGMFDGPDGPRGDAATWKALTTHDGSPPEVDPDEQQALPYLPDPLAYGAAMRYVPPANPKAPTSGVHRFLPPAGHTLRFRAPYGEEDTNVLHIPFDGTWPDVRPFRIRVFEPTNGADEPYFEEAKRILHVPLEKGEVGEMWVSCYPEPSKPVAHGVWRIMTADVARSALTRSRQPLANVRKLSARMAQVGDVKAWAAEAQLEPSDIGLLSDLAVHVSAGLHWMVTPFRKLTLVHATQQPLVAPDLVAAKLRTVRSPGDTWAYIDHGEPIAISGRSTAKIAVRAEWTDVFDVGEEDEQPRQARARAVLPDQMVEPTDSEYKLSGRYTRQDFGDTRHRLVKYTAVATSRFREYFDVAKIDQGKLEITREGAPAEVHVPSTARPPAPRVHSVIPAFGWERIGAAASPAPPSTVAPGTGQPRVVRPDTSRRRVVRPPRDVQVSGAAMATASRREGGGLRVYLERPWFVSGADELLGVVLATPPPAAARNNRAVGSPASAAPLTRWGMDPMWVGAPVDGLPAPEDFLLATVLAEDVVAVEAPDGPTVAVAGHPVAYDPVRRLWFADIQVDTHGAYWPFIRLALARFQPYSVDGLHLSPIAVADFAQLAPERYAILSLDKTDATKVTVSVDGPTYRHGTLTSRMEVSVEQKGGAGGDLGWIPASDEPVVLTNSGQGTEGAWSGTVTLPAARTARTFRLVIREYEVLLADGAPPFTGPVAMLAGPPDAHAEPRLVYADVLPVEG
jgi:hypothetical protein